MKTKRLFHIILNCLIITIFIGTGIAVLVLRYFANNDYDVVLLGTILIVVGVARAIIYYLNQGYKYPKDITIVSAIIMVGLGIVYLVSKIQIEVLCFGWGIMEIVLGSIETYIDTLEIREKKYIDYQIMKESLSYSSIKDALLRIYEEFDIYSSISRITQY